MIAIQTIFSLLPVFLFLLALILLDSFKLVRPRDLILTIIYGVIVSLICYILNGWIRNYLNLEWQTYTRYFAPPIEEFLKSIYIFVLIKKGRIGFAVDAAIFGFAIGAGFAFIENIYYLIILREDNLLIWVIRGFGTAVMHGGTTAIFAIITQSLQERITFKSINILIPGFLIASVIHSFFNHFVLSPVVLTFVQLIVLPALVMWIFTQSERRLRDWLELGLDTDVRILEYITTGEFTQTRIGQYLLTLKNKFSGEIIADMLCYLRTYLELAIRAKGYLMMRDSGFEPVKDPDIKAKLDELDYLESTIGRTGKLALTPIFKRDKLSQWQMRLLKE
jgi:RsiW-degrading membrane proteinase PrsW (M82 family)